ncbi:acyl-CoA reductase [Pinibacter aurantiacus]|uniref:Acyl-CoA reductase n=1 Tax=Pinibacter aurantiacus TaxID=2851599 RepID=A0A9E2W100_9BACT|nr:acyl-CoA reductase [Pinibacter aurantiacus]MBV4355545.1 acyl-CoA reductase [Pinibacter aurantiacus]
MNLQQRINLLVRLGEYIKSENENWQEAQRKATRENGWFTAEFMEMATKNIVDNFLQKEKLEAFASAYQLPELNANPKKVGIVMAGNIPLVGFHDFLCVFLTGHIAVIKTSSKDNVLIKHLAEQLYSWVEECREVIVFAELLKNCDAYIATGSNNSARYFDYYFSKYPSIIRRNRTSVAILTGNESAEDLEKLSDDIHLYFGLGCRNVTQILVPENYDFVPLINAMKKYGHFADHNKYRNNYDYQLSLQILNNKFYMSDGSTLLVENASPFSPISQVNYSFYKNKEEIKSFQNDENIQCLVGEGFTPFGVAQQPSLTDFADGVDTMAFLKSLS